jgi:serine/threonine-protein kinase
MLAGGLLVLAALPGAWGQKDNDALAAKAQEILKKNCFECHGDPAKKPKKDLNLFDPTSYLAKDRKIVVPESPDSSKMIKRINDDDAPMPPSPRPRLSVAERKVLRDWVAAGAPPAGAVVTQKPDQPSPPVRDPKEVAVEVKGIFQRCVECHGAAKPEGGLTVLDRESLLKDRRVVPGKPEESELYLRVISKDQDYRMPKPGGGRVALTLQEQNSIRDWIAQGAPAFPGDVPVPEGATGSEYVLRAILKDVRKLKEEDKPVEYMRYFSFNHVLAGGVSQDELDAERNALTLVVNSLSWLRDLERPVAIEPTNTVFRVDLRRLGWDRTPYAGSDLNLYDLALLEYPYAAADLTSTAYGDLCDEFLARAKQVRPIPHIRGDWFISTATQPPLYEDFLQLPFELKKLEERLGVDEDLDVKNGDARRAGMTASGVSHNNRVVERHKATRAGYFWKSYDFRSSRGTDNIFRDPLDLHPAGGEMIFALQNGLQGYYVCNAQGARLEAAPTEIVTDPNAADKAVRDGLSCIRCHETGMRGFKDEVLPAMKDLPSSPPGFNKRDVELLYPPQADMDGLLKEDRKSFQDALRALFPDKPANGAVLTPVAGRFLDEKLHLRTAAAELGFPPERLRNVFASSDFASLGLVQLDSAGAVRRDTWEDFYDQVVRNLNAGEPIMPLDAVTRRDYRPSQPPFDVEITINKAGEDAKNKVQVVLVDQEKHSILAGGDHVEILVTNSTPKDVFLEVMISSFNGRKGMLQPGHLQLSPGKQARFPEKAGEFIVVQPGLGTEQTIVFASDRDFPPAERLRGNPATEGRGEVVADRVIHRFYEVEHDGKRLRFKFDPSHMIKKTFEIETR